MNRNVRSIIVLVVVLALVNPLGAAEALSTQAPIDDLAFYEASTATDTFPLGGGKVRNVILCIGDGMGLNQIALSSVRATGLDGRLCMERMPVTGLMRTHSADSSVTDSAAAGTALAAGVKTKNGMIGMTPDGKNYCTILEAAKARGMATGLVVTSTISHATPASFASHVRSRKMEEVIAEQLIANKVNVLLGGGRKFFLPKGDPNSGRSDDRDLIAEAEEAGYLYVTTAAELGSAQCPYVLGLFQFEALTTMAPEPDLATLTRRAIDLLGQTRRRGLFRRQPGFFLMVEGSQIDWACHENDAARTVRQTLLFDQAVQAAIDFALRDRRTLVIVTADHETGGLTLSAGKTADDPVVHWSTKGHSGSPVPIAALGPGAAVFAGLQDNTDVPTKIAQLLGIKPFPRPAE